MSELANVSSVFFICPSNFGTFFLEDTCPLRIKAYAGRLWFTRFRFDDRANTGVNKRRSALPTVCSISEMRPHSNNVRRHRDIGVRHRGAMRLPVMHDAKTEKT